MPRLQGGASSAEACRRSYHGMPEMRERVYREGQKIMKISVKRFLGIHLPALAAITVYLALPIKCPIKYFFHFDCPTCGMTRAMFSLFRGDFASYIHFNPIALPFLLILLFGLHSRLFPISKTVKNAIIIIGVLCVVFVYILRTFFI